MIKFLLDEHVAIAYETQIKRREHSLVVECVGVGSAPRKQSPDSEMLSYCETNELLLVTNNRASMPVHLAGHLV